MARGSIYKRNGGYGYVVDLGLDPATGKRQQRYKQGFRTKKEAESHLEKKLNDIHSGATVDDSSMTVGRYLDEWLPGQKQRVKETTWASYKVAVERIKRGLGRRRLQSLKPLEIEKFYDKLSISGSKSGKPLKPKF